MFKFFNIGKANAEIERLETEVAAVKSENESLKSNGPLIESAAESMRNELAAVTTSLSAAQAELTSVKADVSRLTSELESEKAKASNIPEQIKVSASAQAAAIVASVGHAPLATVPESSSSRSLTRADFNKLSPYDQSTFAQKGGRITD